MTHEVRRRLNSLPAVAKAGLIVGGYIAALLLALGSAWLNAALVDPIDATASAGMYAFGDSILFFFVFGVASIFPTALALFFLHASRARNHPI